MEDWTARLTQWRADLAALDELDGWVPLSEAEATCGVSRSALRSWYRTGQIRSRLVDGPHGPQRLVQLAEVSARAELSPRIRNRTEGTISLEAQVVALQRRVDLLELRLAMLQAP